MPRRARPSTSLSKRLIAALLAVAMQVLAPFVASVQAGSSPMASPDGLIAADIPICSDHAPAAPSRPDSGDHTVSCTWCHTCCQGLRPAMLPAAPALPEPAYAQVVARRNHEPRQPQGPPRPHPNARAPPLAILA